MLLKVEIQEGMGSVRCMFPAFTLVEGTKPFVFVTDRTEQLKQLEDEGIVLVSTVTEAQYKEHVTKISAMMTKKSKDRRRSQLKQIIATGGKDKIITGSGIEVEVEPEGATPEEIKKEAEAELKALDGDRSGVEDIISSFMNSGE